MKIVFATSLAGNDRILRAETLLRFCKEQGHDVFLVTRSRHTEPWKPYIAEEFHIAIPRHCPPEELAATTFEKNRTVLGRMDFFRPLCVIVDGEDFVGKAAQRLNVPTVSIDPKHAFETTRLSITLPPFALEQLRTLREELRQRSFEPRWFLLPLFFDALPIRPDTQICQPISAFTQQPTPTEISDEDWLLLLGWQGVEDDVRPFLEQQISVRVHYPVNVQKPREIKQEESLEGEGAVMRRRRSAPPTRTPEEEATAARAMLPNSDAYVSYSVASTDAWLQDLPRAKAVILQGDASRLSDAIALRKPVLVVPQKDHFEQWVCGQYIEKMGVGETHTKLNRTAIDGFLERIERYQEKLNNLPPNKSPKLTDALQSILTILQTEAQEQTRPSTHSGDSPRPRSFRPDGDSPRPRSFRPDGDSPRPRSFRPDGDSPRPRSFRPDGEVPRPRSFRPDGDSPRPRNDRPDGDSPRPRNDRPDGRRDFNDSPRPRFSRTREEAPRPRAEGGRRPASSEQGERAGSIEVWRPPSKQQDEKTSQTNERHTEGGDRRQNAESSGEQRKPWRKPTDGGGEQRPWRKPTDGGGEQRPWRKPTDGGGEQRPWRKPTDGGGEQRPWRKEGGDRPPRQPSDAPREQKPWKKEGGDRPPRRQNTDQSGEQRPWRKPTEVGDEKKPWRKPTEGGGEQRPWRKPAEGGGEQRPWRKPTEGGGKQRPWRKPTDGGDEKKPWHKPAEGGEQRPWRKEGGDRPPRKSSDAPREQRPWRKPTEGGDEKKPWRKPTEGGGEQKPWRKSTEPSGEKKPWKKEGKDNPQRPHENRSSEPKRQERKPAKDE